MNDIASIVTGLGIAAVVLCVCGILVMGYFANAVGSIRRELLGQPEQRKVTLAQQPIEVREHKDFATHSDLAAVEVRVVAVDADLRALRKEIVANGETRRASIEAKVEQTRNEAREHTESVRVELSAKIDQIPAQMIAMLKNTGAIK